MAKIISRDSELVTSGSSLKIGSSGSVFVNIAGTTTLFISNSVGIGSSVPINKLDVVGNISASVVTASLFYGTASVALNAISSAYAPEPDLSGYVVNQDTNPNVAIGPGSGNVLLGSVYDSTQLLLDYGAAKITAQATNGLTVKTDGSTPGQINLYDTFDSSEKVIRAYQGGITVDSVLTVPNGIIANLNGTASFANTASVATKVFGQVTGSLFGTASVATKVFGQVTGSLFGTASFAVTSSLSHRLHGNVTGSLSGSNVYLTERLAIGTSTPSAKIHVVNSSNDGLVIGLVNGSPWAMQFYNQTYSNNKDNGFGFFIDNGGTACFTNGGSAAGNQFWFSTTTAKNGFGGANSSPTAIIDIRTYDNTAKGLVVRGYPGNPTQTGNWIDVIDSGSNSVFVVAANNRVGIGKSSPVNKLDVAGNISCSFITASVIAPNLIQLPYSASNRTLTPNVTTGSMYVNVTDNFMYVYNGTAWRSASLL